MAAESTDQGGVVDRWQPRASYTSTDDGDGTFRVPLLNSDVPDVSVERVPAAENDEGRDLYYMISTTMHLSPGAPIMKSYDLVNWEIVNYVFDRASDDDAFALRNGESSYGQGQWASSLRYHDGRFYVAFNTNNLGGSYLYTTDDVDDGAWDRIEYGRAFHDPSLFFDDADGGTPYIFYGAQTTSAVRLSDDLTAVVEEYPDIIRPADYPGADFLQGLFEGAQVQYIDGRYYIVVITWPPGEGRQVSLFRSDELLGRYATADGSNPYETRSGLDSNGFAQGSILPVANAQGGTDWWGMFFRDTFPIGRIPALIPATWTDGWPVFGRDGTVEVDGSFDKPIALPPARERYERTRSVVASDDFANDAPRGAWTYEGADDDPEAAFNGSTLDPVWQWNHAPDNRNWSLTDRDGWLRLTTGDVVTGGYRHDKLEGDDRLTWFEEARNTLSQRTFGPTQSVETTLDVSGMKDGDVAGLAVYNRDFAYAGVRRENGATTLGVVFRGQPFETDIDQEAIESFVPGSEVELDATAPLHVKADLDFASVDGELWTTFRYSTDGVSWKPLGERTGALRFDGALTHFMGHRVGLFNYATRGAGGHVDVDEFLLGDALGTDAPDTAALTDAVERARTLGEDNYPAKDWTALTVAVDTARRVLAGEPGTQNRVDAAERSLSREIARLGAALEAEPLDVTLRTGSACVAGRLVLGAWATNHGDVPVGVRLEAPWGSREQDGVAPGRRAAHVLRGLPRATDGGTVTLVATAEVDGVTRTTAVERRYAPRDCGG